MNLYSSKIFISGFLSAAPPRLFQTQTFEREVEGPRGFFFYSYCIREFSQYLACASARSIIMVFLGSPITHVARGGEIGPASGILVRRESRTGCNFLTKVTGKVFRPCLCFLNFYSKIKIADAITVVHSPRLSPTPLWVMFVVRTILLEIR